MGDCPARTDLGISGPVKGNCNASIFNDILKKLWQRPTYCCHGLVSANICPYCIQLWIYYLSQLLLHIHAYIKDMHGEKNYTNTIHFQLFVPNVFAQQCTCDRSLDMFFCSSLTVKPGRCPMPKGTPMCAEYCYHDGECPDEQKCCRTTCGHACSEPC